MRLSPFVLNNFSEEELNELCDKYLPQMNGLTSEEKEDKLVELVSNGEISAEIALALSIKEGILG